MATLREYYETGFSHCAKVHIKILIDQNIEGVLLYDFAGFFAFLSIYVPGTSNSLEYFINLLSSLEYGKTQFHLDGKITLPEGKEFPGSLRIETKDDFQILAKYYGEEDWVSTKDIQASRRIFVHSETDLCSEDLMKLKVKAKEFGHDLQFRADKFRMEKSMYEHPLAFISHDSRDKDEVAKKIAIKLQSMRCPVWYDDFALKIGDNLRDSIEKGLKECKKCILILSPHFLSNNGWTKREFDSIFTREILEESKLVLPVWYGVTKKDVYEYSPSLLNVKGAVWETSGAEEICRQLYNAIMS